MKGTFITFEGGEGGGKTEQTKLLANYLTSKGIDVFATKEPGGHVVGDLIRNIALNPIYKGHMPTIAELFLFEAARSCFITQIQPYLNRGFVVLSDRFTDSTLAYQGYGRGFSLEKIKELNQLATGGLVPDLTFLLNISAFEGLQKAEHTEFGKADRFEDEGAVFHNTVNEGFLKIAKENPERMKIIKYIPDGIDAMQREIRKYVDALLSTRK